MAPQSENSSQVGKEALRCPVPNEPENNTTAARKALDKHNKDAIEVACLMLATMSPDLQKNMEDMNAFDMIEQLKGMFQKQARQERYDTMKQLIRCKMQEGPLLVLMCLR